MESGKASESRHQIDRVGLDGGGSGRRHRQGEQSKYLLEMSRTSLPPKATKSSKFPSKDHDRSDMPLTNPKIEFNSGH